MYIGSTVCDLVSQRMVKHRGSYKQWKKNNKNYTTSYILFEEYGYENCIIELIEAKPCTDNIRTLECVNKHIPGRTDKEYYQANKVKILYYKKEYNETNKENMNEISKQYLKDNKEIKKNACECGGRYTFKNKSSHLRSARHLKYLDNPISGYSLLYA